MCEFKGYHPLVNFIYFFAIILCSSVFMHPIFLILSLTSAIWYMIMLEGRKALRLALVYMLPLILASFIINPLFNHQGATILLYFPDGNPLTFESIIYGVFAAIMIVSVICWFKSFSVIITSDKIMYLFGKALPSLSLVFSMVLRFVPQFKARFSMVNMSQRLMAKKEKSLMDKMKILFRVFIITVTWSLESSVDMADSMKSRGYKTKKRTAYSNYTLRCRDYVVLGLIVAFLLLLLTGYFLGNMAFSYFPTLAEFSISYNNVWTVIVYFLLCFLPIIIEYREAYIWKKLKSKI